MVQGTTSHAGKTTVVAGICRLLSDAGYSVAPFKAQNMSLNSTVTPSGGEIAMSQAVQARAAGIPPKVDMNPVLLKPNGEGESQVVVRGEPVADLSSEEYYDRVDEWMEVVEESYHRLAGEHDVVVAEGAGSPAEINIRDFANMPTADAMEADVLLVADIERGGLFASVYGTLELLGDDADRVKGFLVNKFRGDLKRLEPGLRELEEMTGTPCAGVIPHDDPGLPAEDSLSIEGREGEGDVAVIRHPSISNFTDFEPLERAGVGVRFVEPGEELGSPDAVILPGTKRTLDDLRRLKDSGLAGEVSSLAEEVPVLGICGGYQMMGERVVDEVECVGEERGLGLLPVETRFETYEKTTRWTEVDVDRDGGLLEGVDELEGYEIHHGETDGEELSGLGAVSDGGQTAGIYLHGLFHNPDFLERFLEEIDVEGELDEDDPYERTGELVEKNLDLEFLERSLEVEL